MIDGEHLLSPHSSEGWDVLFGRRVPRYHGEHVAHLVTLIRRLNSAAKPPVGSG